MTTCVHFSNFWLRQFVLEDGDIGNLVRIFRLRLLLTESHHLLAKLAISEPLFSSLLEWRDTGKAYIKSLSLRYGIRCQRKRNKIGPLGPDLNSRYQKHSVLVKTDKSQQSQEQTSFEMLTRI